MLSSTLIDEAGQMSLANTLAVCQAARSLVLLGDPRQLDQPIQGVHPPGAGVSALGHLLGESATVDQSRGVFLDHTWRMHPDICAFTTEQFYEGRLRARPELGRQTVVGPGPLAGYGLRFIPVAHAGNTNASAEEADCVGALIRELLDARAAWVDSQGVQKRLSLDDVLVVAPYNAHVAVLRATLPAGARVGTVDKFQGQEAPIVIYSMATSTADEAPRGMEFLYSLHRLNVATSRARCVAGIVASPVLLTPDCQTREQMRLANPFCRFLELAGTSSPVTTGGPRDERPPATRVVVDSRARSRPASTTRSRGCSPRQRVRSTPGSRTPARQAFPAGLSRRELVAGARGGCCRTRSPRCLSRGPAANVTPDELSRGLPRRPPPPDGAPCRPPASSAGGASWADARPETGRRAAGHSA